MPIVARALSKNPAHRYASLTEMARAVQTIGMRAQAVPVVPVARPRSPVPPRAIPVPPPKPRPPLEAIPTVLPVVVSWRGQIGELTGSMALAAALALVGTTLWAVLCHLSGQGLSPSNLGTIFFLAVGASWAVLVPAKVWALRRGDFWSRRILMMTLGILLGLSTLWLQGWSPHHLPEAIGNAPRPLHHLTTLLSWLPSGQTEGIGYVSYFALVFFVLRWWRMADPRRSQRFSFLPLLAAGVWALLPLTVWPPASVETVALGAVSLVMTSAIVQLVSPWEPPVRALPAPLAVTLLLRVPKTTVREARLLGEAGLLSQRSPASWRSRASESEKPGFLEKPGF